MRMAQYSNWRQLLGTSDWVFILVAFCLINYVIMWWELREIFYLLSQIWDIFNTPWRHILKRPKCLYPFLIWLFRSTKGNVEALRWYDHLEKMYAYLGHSACDIVSICSQKEYLYILCHAGENQARTGTSQAKFLNVLCIKCLLQYCVCVSVCFRRCVCMCMR